MRIEKKIQRTRMRRNGRIRMESVCYTITSEVLGSVLSLFEMGTI